MKLTEYTSQYMDVPAIEESPVNIYCKVKKVEKLGSHDMFIAEVIGVTVDDKYMDEKGRFDLKAADLMTYSHGEYFSLGKKSKALDLYGRIAGRESRNAVRSEIFYRIACIYAGDGDIKNALRSAEYAYSLYPENARASMLKDKLKLSQQ